jgi:hypothetical protein
VSQLYDFSSEAQYRQAEIARAVSLTDDTRQLTALAIAEADADILCLQEVENLDTLHRFEYGYLFKMIGDGYRHKVLIDGNDSRGINLALMAREHTLDGAKIEILEVTSHAHLSYEAAGLYTPDLEGLAHPHDKVFKRDCLEVDLKIGSKRLTVYVVHFKSMGSLRATGSMAAPTPWRCGLPKRGRCARSSPIVSGRMAAASAMSLPAISTITARSW